MLLSRGEVSLQTDVQSIQEVNEYLEINPRLKFTQNTLPTVQSSAFIISPANPNYISVTFVLGLTSAIFMIRQDSKNLERFLSPEGEVREFRDLAVKLELNYANTGSINKV